MTAPTVPADAAAPGAATDRPKTSTATAFKALLGRDLYVLSRNMKEFIPRTVLQPLLLVFPKIGQSVGGSNGASGFSTLLVAGVLASVVMFQGIQAVALPMVQEFGFTREIEDRVLAPLPIQLVAVEKIVAGALQCLVAALIVFPIAKFVPATPVHLQVNWLIVLTVAPLACVMSASLGLMFGTLFDPRTVPLLFGIIVVPLTFLGCIYFPWAQLEAIRWLQLAVLLNPLVYMSEGFRAALTPVPSMSLWAVYPVLTGFTALFTWIGLKTFTRRVLS